MKSDALDFCSIAVAVAVSSACSVCTAQGLPGGSQKPPVAKEEAKEKPAAYVPPMRGAVSQVRRVGGATRGWGDVEVPLTVVIAPDHTGLTMNPAPTLYWYLSRPASFPIVLTLIEQDAVAPLFEREITPSAAPGFQGFALREHGISFRVDTEYEWSVAIVIDPLERSRDVIAQGTIRLVNSRPELDRPRAARRALLEQVALPEVASIDAIPVSPK